MTRVGVSGYFGSFGRRISRVHFAVEAHRAICGDTFKGDFHWTNSEVECDRCRGELAKLKTYKLPRWHK